MLDSLLNLNPEYSIGNVHPIGPVPSSRSRILA